MILINEANKFEYYVLDYTGRIEKTDYDKEYEFDRGNITQIFFNEHYQKLVVGVDKGEIYELPIPAEKLDDDEGEDEEDANERSNDKTIDVNLAY